jgi:hypothetical protein
MNKKEYEKPATRVVKIQHMGMLMTSGGDTFTSIKTDMTEDEVLDFGGGSDGTGIGEPR